MIQVYPNNKEKCCGCRACEQVCPVKCIKMQEDNEGFLYPIVDDDLCIGCGACKRVCPVLSCTSKCKVSKTSVDEEHPLAYGVQAKNTALREKSSSGGVFSVFADYVLSCGGAVYGCTLDGELNAVYKRIEDSSELDCLRRSKYVQSDTGDAYTSIKNDLKDGRTVLFAGTPCQAAGLRSFVGQLSDRLLIVDFICHGVPSPMIFRDYLKWLEQNRGCKVTSFTFRNKDKGWRSSGLQMGTRIQFEDGSVVRNAPAFKDPYMNGFLSDLYLRPICYECPFKGANASQADVTIADFWGLRKVDGSFDDKKGTSLVLVRTSQGKKLFEQIAEECNVRQYDFYKAIQKNQTLLRSAGKNGSRAAFFNDYEKGGFEGVANKYLKAKDWVSYRLRMAFWSVVRKIFSVVLRKEISDVQLSNILHFIRFGIVGLSNTLISYLINVGVLLILRPYNLEYDYVAANIAGFGLSVLWSYYWNNRFVFRLKDGETRSVIKTLMKTYACYGFSGFILNNILSTIWIKGLGISRFISPLLNLPFTIPVNFLLNKLWAYRARE